MGGGGGGGRRGGGANKNNWVVWGGAKPNIRKI